MRASGLNPLHAWLEIRPTNSSQNEMLLQMGKIDPRFVYNKVINTQTKESRLRYKRVSMKMLYQHELEVIN